MRCFWEKIRIGKPNECWPWIGQKMIGGYGLFDRRRDGIRIARRAHRIAYECTKGKIPDGLMLRHKCDNPPCCNPNHLIPGTAKDNSGDMIERRRHWTWQRPERIPRGKNHWSAKLGTSSLPHGENHSQAKLTRSKVREIRDIYAKGKMSQRALAKSFDVSQGLIWQIINNADKYWKEPD